ncbi:MAG: hypothetical protein AAGJ95_16980 [Cyanobacteria bacterium J06554_11]
MFVNANSNKAGKILQIVPRLSPDVDGVGSYALQLANQLRSHHGISSEFLVFRPNPKTRPSVEGFPVHRLSEHDSEHSVAGLLSKVPIDVSTVVLQFSNYPYLRGKLAAPFWLAPALEALQRRGVLVLVMFHELPTLRYRFIRCPNPVQRKLSKQLARLADVVVTNNQAFCDTLAGWVSQKVYCIPNFATIGEPDEVLPLGERDRALVIFGSSDRSRVYRNNIGMLKQVCQRLSIRTVYDIGRPIEWDEQALGTDISTIRTGFLPDAEVSEIMSKALAGVFDYHRFPQNLAKSTVYAAYCAHGLLPVGNGRSLPPQDGIVAGQQYVDTHTLCRLRTRVNEQNSFEDWQRVASKARSHYLTRSLARCTDQFASLFRQTMPNKTRSVPSVLSPSAFTSSSQ